MTARPEDTDPGRNVAGFRYLKRFPGLFDALRGSGCSRDTAGNRDLHFDQYASLLLLYFFSPALTSLRGLQAASASAKVCRATGGGRVSLGSLSEAAGVFDPELLRPILADLAKRAVPVVTGHEAEALRGLTAVDGTFFAALPRMAWALWREERKGVKAHVHFDVLKAVPEDVTVTNANSPEVAELERTLKPGRVYVTDRAYHCHRLFAAIIAAKSSFVGRVQEWVAFQGEELPLTDRARAAGVVRDVKVDRLGSTHHKNDLKGTPVRLVWVDIGKVDEDGKPELLVLCTNRLDLEADLVALAYKYRWWVELFFRWLKCIMGCRHLLSHKPGGVAIQIYVALIASVLVSLWTGKKPTKRTYEWLCMYFQGTVSQKELDRHLRDLHKPRPVKKVVRLVEPP